MQRLRHRALALLPLAVLAAGCGVGDGPAPGAGPEPPRRVFLITVDTLRADHLGWHGYPRDTSPRLDQWAERGVVFERAIVQWPKTGPSFASMFTSLYPHTTGLINRAAQTIPDDYLTLPNWFRERGFKTAAVVSNPVLGREIGWDRGFDHYLQSWGDDAALDVLEDLQNDERQAELRRLVWAGRVNELARPLLASLAAEERLFVWLHYIDPHVPYLLQPGTENPFLGDEHYVGDTLVDLTGEERDRALGDQRELRYYVAQYDANIRVTDRAIGEMLDEIAALGMEDDSLFVMTADHGEELNEHGIPFEHGPVPYNTSVHVPLAVVGEPWIAAGGRVAQPTELIGLFPTLVELLGEPLPEGFEGRSWLPLPNGPGPAGKDASDRAPAAEPDAATGPGPVAFADAGGYQQHLRSIQNQDWQLVLRPANKYRRKPLIEVYHLPSDPLQLDNVAAEFPEVKDRLGRRLAAWVRAAPADVTPHTESARKALKAMGYLD